MRKFLLILIIACIAFGIGRLSSPPKKGQVVVWKQIEAFPPQWQKNNDCLPADEQEIALFELAVHSLELLGEANRQERSVLWLDIGAHKFLSSGIYRKVSGKSVPVCTPIPIYARVADILTKYEGLKGRLEEYQLKLVAKLPNQTPYIVEKVGLSAFNTSPQSSEIFPHTDIRPLARAVLAGFGSQSTSFSEQAFSQMSGIDSLGTGAAQVAAASGHPQALPRIESLMKELLSSVPSAGAIPRETRNRLYELSYAISFSGEAAKKHTAPIEDLMKRKVQSWAPPFGMVELSPKRMCKVLQTIHDDQASAVAAYSFCSDDKIPLEQ